MTDSLGTGMIHKYQSRYRIKKIGTPLSKSVGGIAIPAKFILNKCYACELFESSRDKQITNFLRGNFPSRFGERRSSILNFVSFFFARDRRGISKFTGTEVYKELSVKYGNFEEG